MILAILTTSGTREAKAPRRQSTPFWLWAGVAALALLSVYSAYEANRMRRELAELQQQSDAILQERRQLAKELGAVERAATILTDPSSVQIAMASQEKEAPAMRAYWHAKLGIAVTGATISVPPGERTLQLWLVPKAPGQKPLSAGVSRPQPDGKFILLVGNPPDFMNATKALAITEEPAGGSAQPTMPIRWLGVVG